MDAIDNKVLVVRIDKVEKHPNADRLDLAHVAGWQCVTQRGTFKAGDLAIYIPIDSILPAPLEASIFPPDSKVKLSKSRVKTIKLRGAISQGMILRLEDVFNDISEASEGADVTELTGITHYEPPAPEPHMQGNAVSKKKKNPFFPVYSKLSHFKNYPDLFEEGEEVVVTEKIHGTNFRAGWAPTVADTIWKKVKKFFRLLPEHEFVFGSHQVQLQDKRSWNGFYTLNVYEEAVEKYDLRNKIPLGFVVYGEIYGGGIQKGYHYGLGDNERGLVLFDVLTTYLSHSPDQPVYLSWEMVESFSEKLQVPTAPIIYKGPYRKALVKEWESGPSTISPKQEHREGVVIKPQFETQTWIGRKVLRSINPEYLLKSESDFH